MDILPAIDLCAGAVVRLAQGDYGRQTVYGADPAATARAFVAMGARWIHVVDLDAARSGRRTNADAIAAICRVAGASVELGGGIRDDQAVADALTLGAARAVIGSAALKDWAWFERLARRADLAGRIVLGLDARGGILAGHGWTASSGQNVLDVARRAKELPLAAIVYTDIQRDGMFTGPDLQTTQRIMDETHLPVIASGGIGGLKDILDCRDAGCAGAIVGRAYYEGKVNLAEAFRELGR